MNNCEECGVELKETNWGRKFCPNCGIVSDNSYELDENPSYLR